MSSVPSRLYPVAMLQDRYTGVYSHGQWLAIANASDQIENAGQSRIDWAMGNEGPSGCDLTAAEFWIEPPTWISVGSTPEEAISALVERAARETQNRLLGSA